LDPKEVPRYPVPEAARYLQIPASTLTSWVAGRKYPVTAGERDFPPLIHRPEPDDPRLSFSNLVEAHVLRALRTKHKVPIKAVRTALDYAQEKSGIDRLLLDDGLRATPGEVFLEQLDDLVNIGRRGQTAMKEILGRFLQRIDRDIQGSPLRLFPFTRPPEQIASGTIPRLVVIDPVIASGRPITMRRAIRTSTIADRFNAGESILDLVEDCALDAAEVEEAIRYERPAQIAA
jgi:uncharacterized protein (DUF433 family)